MSDKKFICDRMLKRLAVWLRLSGYDTLCDEVLERVNPRKEDTYLVENFADRILLTRDRELYERRKLKGLPVKLVKSSNVGEQLKEVSELGIRIFPVMKRCTVCNSELRKPTEEEILEVAERENLGEHILKKDLWYCENCKKLYWVGGHWKNMVKFLKKHDLI